MKLGPDEIRRLFLGGIMSIVGIYIYFALFLTPLITRQNNAKAAIAALQPEIETANATIAKFRAVEKSAPLAQQAVAQISALIPEGSPVAWFPPKVADVFKSSGID